MNINKTWAGGSAESARQFSKGRAKVWAQEYKFIYCTWPACFYTADELGWEDFGMRQSAKSVTNTVTDPPACMISLLTSVTEIDW